jgi:hypothetical protein
MNATIMDAPDRYWDDESNAGRPSLPGGRFFRVIAEPRTYGNLVYLLGSFPLGLAYFIYLVTLLSIGAGMAVTVIGLPVLVLVMFSWCLIAEGDRLLTNTLIGAQVPPLRFKQAAEASIWGRIKARVTSGLTWRALVYLFLRFPQGLAGFIATVVLLSVSLSLIAAPVMAEIGDPDDGPWWIDSWQEGLLLTPAGLLLLFVSLHAINLMARGSAGFAQLFLGRPERPAGWGGLAGRAEFVSDSAYAGGPAAAQPLSPAQQREREIWNLGVHAIITAVLSAGLLLINGLTGTGTLWALWPIWGVSIPLAMHAGWVFGRGFGLHAGLFAIVNLGLIVMDVVYGASVWFFYPLLTWGAGLAAHGAIEVRHRRAAQASAPTVAAPPVQEAAPRSATEPVGTLGLVEGPAMSPSGEIAAATVSVAVVVPEPAPISVDVAMRVVRVEGALVELTPKEFDLLVLFVQNPGRPFSRDELLERFWRDDYEVTDRTIDTHVQRLRKKLGGQADAIQTVWGVGYRFGPAAT